MSNARDALHNAAVQLTGAFMLRVILYGFLLLAAVRAEFVFACATCLCGDPTLTTMGVEKPFAGRKRVSIDYLQRSEKAGIPQRNEHEIQEERVTYSVGYAYNAVWMFAASLPMATKAVERYDLSQQQASGVGDLDLSARWVAGGDTGFPRRQLWGLQFGVRLPTSEEAEFNTQPIDFDVQPGAGTTVPAIGAWSGWYRLPWFFYASAAIQHAIDEGYQNYQAGDALLFTGHSQYALQTQFAVQLALDARWKAHDEYKGVEDVDSGGVLIMLSPGIAWTPVTDLVVNASFQYPVFEDANGHQAEDEVLRAGVTYDF